MSVSKTALRSAVAGLRFVHQFSKLVRRSFGVIQGSRMGMAGFAIVLAFAVVAILAPLISPYPRNFEAPDSDRFTVFTYDHSLPPLPANQGYSPPVLGPTTPQSSDRQGGMWLINYARSGFIYMDFTRHIVGTNESPFDAGNESIRFDITQDFTFLPTPRTPLYAVFYIVPGKSPLGATGPGRDNGALAFFAARDFFVIDPFTKSLIFWYPLSFDPTWTGEDPRSAGELDTVPFQHTGLEPIPIGPYHYFYASDGTHTVVFEIVYAYEGSPTTPRGRTVLVINESLSAPPFVYYDDFYVGPDDDFRSIDPDGRNGQLILLPLVNETLEAHNVNGTIRKWVPLTLGGQRAVVNGQIGYTRATAFPYTTYLPLRSAAAVGLAYVDLSSLRTVHEFSSPNPTWEPVGISTSYFGKATYLGLYDVSAGPNGTTHLIGLNDTAAEIPQFKASFPGRVRWFFEVVERSKVFVFPASGGIAMLDTTFRTEASVVPQAFPVAPPPTVDLFRYAGALGGTLYGSALIPAELYGVWTDSREGTTTLFQLLGTPQTPLPPGTYPSGNHYILGTDFKGGDILTQLFYGAQVAFIVGGLAAVFAVGIGTFVGLIAGYFGKIVDTLLMRTTDIFLVLPFLPIVLILASILRPSIWVIILVLGIVGWPGIARVIRAQVLTLKERPFVDAARVSGASDLRLIFVQIAPNVLPFSFLYMSLTVAGAIITEAALSFLGLGDVTVISWGGMLSQVLTFGGALTAWWWLFPPGLAITLLSLGFYMLGRGFDEIINPRLRRR